MASVNECLHFFIPSTGKLWNTALFFFSKFLFRKRNIETSRKLNWSYCFGTQLLPDFMGAAVEWGYFPITFFWALGLLPQVKYFFLFLFYLFIWLVLTFPSYVVTEDTKKKRLVEWCKSNGGCNDRLYDEMLREQTPKYFSWEEKQKLKKTKE